MKINIPIKIVADKETRRERLAKCMDCPFNQDKKCAKCGCSLRGKIMLHISKCPLNKW